MNTLISKVFICIYMCEEIDIARFRKKPKTTALKINMKANLIKVANKVDITNISIYRFV